MNSQDFLVLIQTHNNNVTGFNSFCGKLGEINGGGLPADKWFQLWQLTPPFAKHASEIVKQARAAGVNAKYNAQDGMITVYAPEETEGDKSC